MLRLNVPAEGGPFFLTTVSVQEGGKNKTVRAVFVKREGSYLLVRQMDPGEPEPEPIPAHDGDELEVAQAISHIGFNTVQEGGPETFMHGVRVVQVRREPGVVYARTLRKGEPDLGSRIHAYPGEQIKFEEGAIVAELDHIDELTEPTDSGYVPLTPALSIWFSIGIHDDNRVRYCMAAARALDSVNYRLIDVEAGEQRLSEEGLGGRIIRAHIVRLIADVESALISLGRAVRMVHKAASLIGTTTPVPPLVTKLGPAINEIRHAYEHVEERSVGKVHQKVDPNALMIFDHARLLTQDEIAYGGHVLNIKTDVPAVTTEARQFIKIVAGGD